MLEIEAGGDVEISDSRNGGFVSIFWSKYMTSINVQGKREAWRFHQPRTE